MPRPPDRSARPPLGRPSAPTDDLLAELLAVYRDADRLHAGWSCPASTECCRFGVTRREPYVTSIELAAVQKAAAARGGMRAWKKAPPPPPRPSPSPRRLPLARDERPCPFLDASGRCAVYDARPLGCRTFYCDRAESGRKVQQRQVNALVRRIQDIAARHAPGGDQGRPLSRAV